MKRKWIEKLHIIIIHLFIHFTSLHFTCEFELFYVHSLQRYTTYLAAYLHIYLFTNLSELKWCTLCWWGDKSVLNEGGAGAGELLLFTFGIMFNGGDGDDGIHRLGWWIGWWVGVVAASKDERRKANIETSKK